MIRDTIHTKLASPRTAAQEERARMIARPLWERCLPPGFLCGLTRAWLWIMLALTLLGFTGGPALANEPASRFVWNEVAVTVQLREDGTAHVREHDTVQFIGGPFRQGYREVPLAALDDISQVTVTEVGSGPAQPYDYTPPSAYSRNAPRTYTFQQVGTVIRIEWSFPPTSSTSRTWVIEYVAKGVVRVYADAMPPYQEIWWIGVGSELTQTAAVDLATLAIILSRPVDPAQAVAESNGTPFGGADGQTWVWRKEHLGTGESLEASLRFPPLFAASKPGWQETYDRQMVREAPANLAFLGLALLTAVGGSVGLLATWWMRGRDPVPILIPERLTAPPGDTPPAVVGALLDERVDHRDHVATLLDLGRRGIVRVTSAAQPVVGTKRQTVVTLLQPDAPMAPFERALLSGLFAKTWWSNARVLLSQADPRTMRGALSSVERLLSNELVQRGYFATRPGRTRAGWRFVGIGLWVISAAVLLLGIATVSPPITWPLLASIALAALGAAVFVVSRFMPQKTRAGAEAAARWRAYKTFMEAVNRVDALRGGQEGFERALPYAVAFGIEQPWIDAFVRAAPASTPTWYDPADLDGPWMSSTWRFGGRLPLPTAGLPLPDVSLPHLGGPQGMSELAASSLQASSNTLFDLFDEIGYAFTPQPSSTSARPSLSNTNSSGPDLGLQLGAQIFFAVLSGGKGSGGGGGGFS